MLRDVERASNPWGKRAVGARGLGRGARRAGARAGRSGARVPVLGRVRVVVRRARAAHRRVDREAAAGGGRRLRDPRPARELHRRPGAADGQRVRVPGVRRGERRDAERGRRHEDHRQLPALLQHARERVPRLRRQLRGDPPLRAARARSCARAGSSPARDDGADDHLPRLLLPRAPQRRARGAARARRGGRRRRSRWSAPARRRSAAAPAAPTCGWRSAPSRSTRSASARRPRPAPTRSPSPARSAR